jgi:hypothetical protein
MVGKDWNRPKEKLPGEKKRPEGRSMMMDLYSAVACIQLYRKDSLTRARSDASPPGVCCSAWCN